VNGECDWTYNFRGNINKRALGIPSGTSTAREKLELSTKKATEEEMEVEMADVENDGVESPDETFDEKRGRRQPTRKIAALMKKAKSPGRRFKF
jgi:hypothetical protein